MLFRSRFHGPIARGEVTLTIRDWSRPQAKAGGRYRVADVVIEVTAVARITVGNLDESHARRGGFESLAALLAELECTARRPLPPAHAVWVVEFHVSGAYEPPLPTAVSPESIARARKRLDALDALRPAPWTGHVLAWIGEHPGTASRYLATELRVERLDLKADIRKLKAAGLTRSLITGYELTDLGKAVVSSRMP